ncbi:acetyltransferase [Salmonella enterica]
MFDLLTYYFYIIFQKKKAKKARHIFNYTLISKRKKLITLKKTGVKVSEDSTITAPFYFENGNIIIDKNVFINANCVFLDAKTIDIGCNSAIGPNVVLTTVTHPLTPSKRPKETICAPIKIGRNVWIGVNTTVLPGVKIGDNSVIAANSVVNTDVPANTMYAGSPATLKKYLKGKDYKRIVAHD